MRTARSESGQGYSVAAPSEWHYLIGSNRSWLGQNPLVVYCHGSGGTALNILGDAGQREMLFRLSEHHMVIAGDFGFQAFGNDTHRERIGEAIAYARDRFGVSGPVIMVGGSMGALGALGYALVEPDEVRGVAAFIPGLDLADLMLRGAATDIDAAYPPAYDDETDGPLYSPVQFAANLDPDLPISLFTASDDTISVPATADAFVAARPQTARVDLGALGHSTAAVTASVEPIMEFVTTSV